VKDSKEYSKKVAAFFKKNRSKTTFKPYDNEDKVDNLIFSVLYEHLTIEDAHVCEKLMQSHFMDWNDLRVSRMEEVLDVLASSGIATDTKKKVAQQLIKSLNCVFAKYDRISFEDIDELGKRQANQELAELEEFTPFMINFLMLNFKGSHSLPVNSAMAQYARDNGLVDPDSTDAEVSSFLQRQIAVDDVYDFYLTLRQQTECPDKEESSSKSSSKSGSSKKASSSGTTKKKSAANKKAAVKKTTAKKTKKAAPKKKSTAKKTTKKAVKKTPKKTAKKKAKK
jgi:hypothetical protein